MNIKRHWQFCVYFLEKDLLKKYTKNLEKKLTGNTISPKAKYFTAIGFDNSGGYHVVDIWESEQDFNNFVTNTIKPVMDKFNAPMPKGEIIPIHNANAFQGIDSYKIK